MASAFGRYHTRPRTLHSIPHKVESVSTFEKKVKLRTPIFNSDLGIDSETCNEGAWPSKISDVFKTDPFFADAEKWSDFDRSLRGKSPTPVKPRISPPRDCEVAFDADGKGSRPLPSIFVSTLYSTGAINCHNF